MSTAIGSTGGSTPDPATGAGTTGPRTRYGRSQIVTATAVGTDRALRAAVGAWRKTTSRLTRMVTPAGRLLAALAVMGLATGLPLGLVEFTAAGTIALVLLAAAAPFLLGVRDYDAQLHLERDRLVAGGELVCRIAVRNPRRTTALPGLVEFPVGDTTVTVPVPLLPGRATRAESITVPGLRRGILRVGPLTAVRSDPLGLMRAERRWHDPRTVFVHPATVGLPSTSTGFVKDLEGTPSTVLADTDLSFHAIRDYAPGDPPRQVHWKSTAKTGALMVRQYEQTRRSRMLVITAAAASEAASEEEFELVVGVAASLGLRGIRDGRDIDVVVGGEVPELARRTTRTIRPLPTRSTRALLDAMAGLRRSDAVNGIGEVATLAAEAYPDVSVAFVVCGSPVPPGMLRAAALRFPPGVGVAAVVCDPTAPPRVRRLAGMPVLTVGLLADLAHLLARSAQS
jgi:uncharacterized protein (DUF58 family)